MTRNPCPMCGGPVRGRVDKRYCSTACKRRAFRAAHLEEIRERERVEGNARLRRKWRTDTAFRQRQREAQRERRRADPRKHRARNAVAEAVRRGRLLKPSRCERCGQIGRVEASHDDYDRPLDVEWLCPRCHRRKDLGLLKEVV